MNLPNLEAADVASDARRLIALTDKQREVLDLLIHFKTSKEISRTLQISPHTVDQRIDAAKLKLGAGSRADLAVIYRDLVGDAAPVYDRVTYDDSCIARSIEPQHRSPTVGNSTLAMLEDTSVEVPVREERDYRVVPELFDGRWGTIARLAAIFGIAGLLCIAFLGGLAIMVQVSSLVGR